MFVCRGGQKVRGRGLKDGGGRPATWQMTTLVWPVTMRFCGLWSFGAKCLKVQKNLHLLCREKNNKCEEFIARFYYWIYLFVAYEDTVKC